jgi:DNA-binding NarL/FixJ family response regulator
MLTRILIADDHEIVREGMISLLAKSRPDWQIRAEATNGEKAIHAIRQLHPDLVVMDITMPGMNGLEASSRLRTLGMNCPVLIFTMHDSDRLITDVRSSGAQGYVLKSQAGRDLRAIDTLLSGGTFFGAPRGSGPVNGDAPDQDPVFRRGLAPRVI